MTKLIRGKVARILNSREVALNVGAKNGVADGMQFDILAPELHNITDPDTNEVIGSVNRPKVRVRVGITEDRFCVARTFRRWRVNIGGEGFDIGMVAADLFKAPKWVTKSETLKTSESTWENLSEEDSFVKTGDPVVQVPESMATEAGESAATHDRGRKATA